MPPRKPERGHCEPDIEELPAIMPNEQPIPVTIPEKTPVTVPSTPEPEKVVVR